jgi:hypothetical protein
MVFGHLVHPSCEQESVQPRSSLELGSKVTCKLLEIIQEIDDEQGLRWARPRLEVKILTETKDSRHARLLSSALLIG